MSEIHSDKSNGYEAAAEHFMATRNPHIGAATVRTWCRTLAPSASVLDLGCGNGVPISQVLIEEGFSVYCLDASEKMIEAFRERFPNAHAECSPVEDSEFFHRKFEGVIAWGLMFLLPAEIQPIIIHKVAGALNLSGKFLFTSPKEPMTWRDSITGRESVSLGAERYRQLLVREGFIVDGEQSDEGENHYYLASKHQNT